MIIRIGARGDGIKDIQESLNALGFGPVDADGIFGAATETAIRLFQEAHELGVDGIVGPATRQILGAFKGSDNFSMSDLKNSSVEKYPLLLQVLKHQQYQVLTEGKINIIGVRNSAQKANSFDDRIYLIWEGSNGWNERSYAATCDPGTYWLEHGRVEGTAILIPGQYVNVYKFDLHGGKYETLCQRGGEVKVWRDSNKDEILDHAGKEIEGYFGINIHHAGTDSKNVDKWSAGCQVFARLADWQEAMEICKQSNAEWFTYTLIEERDI
tara:strand:+ start:1269 stop:2075 length:807 start_codon:yes stop_codon:yes gene_type:complete